MANPTVWRGERWRNGVPWIWLLTVASSKGTFPSDWSPLCQRTLGFASLSRVTFLITLCPYSRRIRRLVRSVSVISTGKKKLKVKNDQPEHEIPLGHSDKFPGALWGTHSCAWLENAGALPQVSLCVKCGASQTPHWARVSLGQKRLEGGKKDLFISFVTSRGGLWKFMSQTFNPRFLLC